MVDVILSRREDFTVFDTYISEYDRSMSLLEESCRNNPAFASVVKTFEVGRTRREPDLIITVELTHHTTELFLHSEFICNIEIKDQKQIRNI